MGLFSKTDLQIGHKGQAAKVREKALAEVEYNKKLELLQGCVKAFDEGRPENLRMFLGSYLEFKRKNGSLEKLATHVMDDGFINLVAKPMLGLIEKSKMPADTIETLTCDMSAFYKQVALDLTLREACSTSGSWFVAEAVLAAGADANTGGGRPLVNALRDDKKRILEILYAYGADFDAPPTFIDAAADAPHFAKAADLKQKFNGIVALKKPMATIEPKKIELKKPVVL